MTDLPELADLAGALEGFFAVLAATGLRATALLFAGGVLGFALTALGAALTEAALGIGRTLFLTGAGLVALALLFLEAAVAGDLELVLVALRAGAFSAAGRFFSGCGVAVLPTVARFLAEDVFEL